MFSCSSGVSSGLGGTEGGLHKAHEREWQEGKQVACATASHEMPQLSTFQLHPIHCLALIPSIMMAIITYLRQLPILAGIYGNKG